MTIEILFGETANLFGDMQNMEYLKKTLPDAAFVETALPDKPYFVDNTPDMIYMGAMTEHTQRRVIEALAPYRERLASLIDGGTLMLFTGNAGETLFRHISYVTEKIETDGLDLVPLTAKTDLFDRYNGKALGHLPGAAEAQAVGPVTGFRSQFSRWYGENADNAFLRMDRGMGLNEDSALEGWRDRNLICTAVIGPILPLNPKLTEYLCSLMGVCVPAAFRDAAIRAWEQRVIEMEDPETKF